MKKIALVLAVAGVLSGCQTHQLLLMSQKGGETATGTATSENINGSGGKITINLRNKVYSGRWVGVTEGSRGFGMMFIGSETITSSYGATGATNGNAFLKSPDGSGLRCVFTWSQVSYSGMGRCSDDAGVVYDMQIR